MTFGKQLSHNSEHTLKCCAGLSSRPLSISMCGREIGFLLERKQAIWKAVLIASYVIIAFENH